MQMQTLNMEVLKLMGSVIRNLKGSSLSEVV